eukprot:gene261-3636_t
MSKESLYSEAFFVEKNNNSEPLYAPICDDEESATNLSSLQQLVVSSPPPSSKQNWTNHESLKAREDEFERLRREALAARDKKQPVVLNKPTEEERNKLLDRAINQKDVVEPSVPTPSIEDRKRLAEKAMEDIQKEATLPRSQRHLPTPEERMKLAQQAMLDVKKEATLPRSQRNTSS